jgi:type II secretory pathway pseudopilin PulG
MQEPKMTKPHPIRPRPSPSEEGYILIAVIFLLALLIVAMSIAVPNISKQIERDREVETMHRGKQYVRALKLYYKKFGNYPMNVDALVNTNQIRFLRKKYIDPSTGKDEWKPIHMGEQKQPTAFGFFGKPMASQLMGGMGANCGMSGLNSSGLGSPTLVTPVSALQPWLLQLSSSSLGSSGLNSSMGMGTNSPIGGCPTDSSSHSRRVRRIRQFQ